MKAFVLLLLCLAWAESKNYTNYRLMKANPLTASGLLTLKELEKQDMLDIDFWISPTRVNRSVEFLVSPKNYPEVQDTLRNAGIEMSVMTKNIQRDIDKENGSANSFLYSIRSLTDSYATYDQIVTLIKGYAGSYSHARVIPYGKSYEGRELYAIKFSVGPGRKTIFIEAGMHCREWIAIASTLKIIERMATERNIDADITNLLDRYDWVFVPVVNPDGYHLTHTQDRMWRKNVKPNRNGCIGTDLNRNFDANWGGEGASPNPCHDTYHGDHAFSELETRALSELVRSTRNKIAFFSVHAYSQYILTPYGCTDKKPKDYAELNDLAIEAAQAIYASSERKFVVGTPPDILYIASGGAYDWAKMKMEVKYSYAFELRPDPYSRRGFIMPQSEIYPSSRDLLAALKTFAAGFKF